MESFKNFQSDQNEYREILVKDSLLTVPITAQVDQPLLVGAVVDWNRLSIDLLSFVEKIQMNITVAIICSNVQNLTQTFQLKFEKNFNWITCHVSPFTSCVVLSAILWDEYFTSAVRTKILGKYDLFSLFLPWLRTSLLFNFNTDPADGARGLWDARATG